MRLKNRKYLIFQVAISVVTFIIMFLYQIIHPASFVRPEDVFQAAALLSIYPTIIFTLCSAIAWKIWKGKSWYSLSLILLCATLVVNILINLSLGCRIDSDFTFVMFLFSLDLFICFPATLIIFILAGIIGRLCLTMNNRVHLL